MISTGINRFNIRVYGFLLDQEKILVTDEFRLGIFMTKFPGGGLQFGEGTVDCLKREFLEELDTKVEIVRHVYTTDFFQPTTLLPSEMQLFNIYYLVSASRPFQFKTTLKVNDIPAIDGAQSFRWMNLDSLTPEEFTFPIDRYIVRRIRQGLLRDDQPICSHEK